MKSKRNNQKFIYAAKASQIQGVMTAMMIRPQQQQLPIISRLDKPIKAIQLMTFSRMTGGRKKRKFEQLQIMTLNTCLLPLGFYQVPAVKGRCHSCSIPHIIWKKHHWFIMMNWIVALQCQQFSSPCSIILMTSSSREHCRRILLPRILSRNWTLPGWSCDLRPLSDRISVSKG